MKFLGIDYGDRKVGLAFGDSEARVAVPLEVIQNTGEQTMIELQHRVQQDEIDCVVVGVPLATGTHHSTDQLKKTLQFVDALKTYVTIPVMTQNEARSTRESIRLQREDGALAQEDALSAMLILQSYIDSL